MKRKFKKKIPILFLHSSTSHDVIPLGHLQSSVSFIRKIVLLLNKYIL